LPSIPDDNAVTVLFTARQNGREALDFLSRHLCSPQPLETLLPAPGG
jgi:hypothetical protein